VPSQNKNKQKTLEIKCFAAPAEETNQSLQLWPGCGKTEESHALALLSSHHAVLALEQPRQQANVLAFPCQHSKFDQTS
jgi:hypothetical protein